MVALRAWFGACVSVLMLAACGGGGGGAGVGDSGSTGNVPVPAAYSNVQPASPPAASAPDTSRASGTVSVAADTLDASGRKAGVSLELHPILPDGSLGPIAGVASTAADGGFSIAMPAGSSTADGSWMLLAQTGSVRLRAYVYPGAVRVDVSSEAWVREVVGAVGRVLAFPGKTLTTVSQIAGAFGLYADASGDQRAALAPSAAADQIVRALAGDHALNYVISTLRNTSTLPSDGTGDIGAFYAMSDTYAAFFVDGKGQPVRATLKNQYGTKMADDGSWGYDASASTQTNGQWLPDLGAHKYGRLSASRGYQTLSLSGVNGLLVSSVVGEFPSQSFPVQPGARQLDARRITDTKLNFTGGSDVQPMAFSVNEQIGAVESISIGAGNFRAVRVVTEQQIVVPKSSTSVTTIVSRSTIWVAPGVGVLKASDQVFIDGVEDKSSASSLELTSAYANGIVWPAQLTLGLNYLRVDTHYCLPVVLPALRRFVTVENGPSGQSFPTFTLALWDLDTGAKVGASRNFSGLLTYCPVRAGDSSSLLVPESSPSLNPENPWPKTAAEALAQSDVVHQVSGKDLADMASYTLPPVPDAVQPLQYWPVGLDALFAAPDGSGRFVVGFFRKNYFNSSGGAAHYIRVLGPALASPVAHVDNELLLGVDWTNGRFFSSQSIEPFALRMRDFSSTGGVDVSSSRAIRSGDFVAQLWYASASLLHLNDGSTIRISDGTPGPKLPYTSSVCALGNGTLVCVDSTADQLVKLDSDTLAVQARAGLGSYLRSLSQTPPDFRVSNVNARGTQLQDDSTFLFQGSVVRVGRWSTVPGNP